MAEQKLLESLAGVRRRLLGVSLACGLAWGVVALLIVLIACAWVDLALDLTSGVRLACSFAAIGAGFMLLAGAGVTALRSSNRTALARRLDLAANGRGQILSGVDLFHQYSNTSGGAASAQAGGLPAAMARIAVERAAALAGQVRAASAVPGKPLFTPLLSLGGILLALGVVGLAAPRLFGTQWSRFTDPFGDHPPYSAITFDVKPGDTMVRYGGGLDVRAKPDGGNVDQLDLVLLPGADKSATNEEVLPMFPEPGGTWRATVTDVTAAGKYLVRTRGVRSKQFSYGLITVPQIKSVKFRVTPPAYTHRPPYEGPVPQNGIAGLPGTKVEVWATSNRPLSSGAITFSPGPEGTQGKPSTAQEAVFEPATRAALPGPIALSPTGSGSSEVSGSFLITRPCRIDLKVTDVANEPSNDTFSASVSLLRDDKPFVRILEPKPNSFATPDVSLPISILAEDDYGVTRVQVFRSLNDSRPLGLDVPLPATTQPSWGAAIPPTRLPVGMSLPLAKYGLTPGDVIKLFARVEDNDPNGPKGSESSVVTVQIISREDLNRMTLAREGMEVLQSKYDQAQRRLEALDNEIRKEQEELNKLDPDSKLAKDKEKELDELAKRVAEEADAIQDLANEDLPFDIDKKLREQLKQLANETKLAGQEFEKSLNEEKKKGNGIGRPVAGKKLDELREKIGQKKDELKDEANDPIEHLAKIFPLKEDEARFAELYLRQQDLAERMAALKAAGADDPKSKSRMRDLEQEQKELRDELRDILNDIDSHVAALPDDPKLDGLRETAKQFADAVRSSEAAEQMQGSENRLSEFNGPEAAQLAQRAADTLKKFIGQCNGMGDQASMCLGFKPKLSSALGNTVDQLLQAQGLSMGRNRGMNGAGGGYSSRRSTLNNVGLYGSLPRISHQSGKNGSARNAQGSAVSGAGQPTDPNDPNGFRPGGRMQAAGESGANVPAVYRKKVGAYFERVADELGDDAGR
jgi:hypothetical protein